MTLAYFLIDEDLTQCVRCDYWNDLDAKSCRNCREVL
jgi:ribosomal protein L40E